jgi:hypothetical protein
VSALLVVYAGARWLSLAARVGEVSLFFFFFVKMLFGSDRRVV